MEHPYRRQLTNKKIDRLLQVMKQFRLYDREVPIQVICTLLYIGSRNTCHKQALEEDLNLTSASSSRNTDWLSKEHRLKLPSGERKAGLDLIRKEVDLTRRQRLTLTKKGEDLMKQIEEILYGKSSDVG